jgi:hypothetical protein
MHRAAEHLGPERAARYLRQFYPWYLGRIGAAKTVQQALQQTASLDEARAVLAGLGDLPRAA